MQIIKSIQQFARDEQGVTAIEYGLLAAVVATAVVAAGVLLKDGLDAAFGKVKAALSA
jgi:pilus assembly protein Flp/PilA